MLGQNKGFTLIELMVVVAIIGILAAVAVPQYQKMRTTGKPSKEVQALVSEGKTLSTLLVKKGTQALKAQNEALKGSAEAPAVDPSTYHVQPGTPQKRGIIINVD